MDESALEKAAAEKGREKGVGVRLDFETLFHLAPNGSVVTRPDGTILEANDVMAAWTGQDRTSLAGRSFPRLLPVGDRILYSTHVLPQLGLGQSVPELSVEILGAGGSRRQVLLAVRRVAWDPPDEGEPITQLDIITLFEVHDRGQDAGTVVSALHRAEESEIERARAQASLERAALHDALTGLLNRAGVSRHLDARTPESPAAIVFAVNLDHFRVVDESLGSAAGDELLREMARRLAVLFAGSGVVARTSGDSFVVVDERSLARSGTGDEARSSLAVDAAAASILDAVVQPVVIEELEIVVTASIGIVLSDGDTGTSGREAHTLLHDADVAMFQAKAAGRNTARRYRPSGNDSAVNRLRLLGELRRALEYDEFRMLYQPQFDPTDGTVRGAEALVRWQHPTRGLLGPGEFVGLAEDSGFIVSLGEWVLREAVRDASTWRESALGQPVPNVSVNVSARQLAAPGLVEAVTAALRAHSLDGNRLTIEVTETALLGDAVEAGRILHRLKESGVRISIDDFGTGHAGFSYLKLFPVDELKIDRSFIRGVDTRADDAAIVSSCIQLAHGLGITVVAEGVERPSQQQALLALGCDLVQGYLLGRPAPQTELDWWRSADPVG